MTTILIFLTMLSRGKSREEFKVQLIWSSKLAIKTIMKSKIYNFLPDSDIAFDPAWWQDRCWGQSASGAGLCGAEETTWGKKNN